MSSSTPEERFHEARRVFRDASENKTKDLKEATTATQVDKILRNVEKAEILFLRAGRAILEKNGAEVETAFHAAKDANDTVTKAREDAEAIADKIRKVSSALTAVGTLIAKAAL